MSEQDNEVRVGQKRDNYTVAAVFKMGDDCGNPGHKKLAHVHYTVGLWDETMFVVNRKNGGDSEDFWRAYLPPRPIERRDPPTFKRGQVWALNIPNSSMRCVFRALEDSTRPNKAIACTALASEGYSNVGMEVQFQPDYSGRHAVLVQDVGEPEPRKPAVVFDQSVSAGIDWRRWLPPRELPNDKSILFKVGQVWAMRKDWVHSEPHSQVFRVKAVDKVIGKHAGRDNHYMDVEKLAGTGGESYSNRDFTERCVLVQDVGEARPREPMDVFGGSAFGGATTGGNCRCVATPDGGRRVVSTDGRTWVDYERLADGDAFEAYPWRHVVRPDGAKVDVVAPPACDRCGTRSAGLGVGRLCAACYKHWDNDVLRGQQKTDEQKRIVKATAAANARRYEVKQPRPQSLTGGFVGVWDTRGR